MKMRTWSAATLCCVGFLGGAGGAAAEDAEPGKGIIRTAELTPRSTTPARPLRPASTLPAKTLADINRRLAAMQAEINRLKSEVNGLRARPAPSGGGQSTHSADEAYTMAAEARAIALRAEQKADQALAAASSH